MNDSRTLRVAGLLLAIYLAGLATGWWLAPRGGGQPLRRTWAVTKEGIPVKPGSVEMEIAVMKEFEEQLKLSGEQRTKVREQVNNWAVEVRQMPRPLPRLRLAAMEKWCAAIRTNLTPEQLPAYDEMVETARRLHLNAPRPGK